MRFEVPYIINELPVKADWRAKYPDNPMQAKLAYLTAKKVYKRTRAAEAQNWRCCWCGVNTVPEPNKHNSVTLEHIVPRSHGGSNEMDNLAAACARCNSKRGTSEVEVFMQTLFDRAKMQKVA